MTPYDVVTQVEQPRPATKAELVALSRRLELVALAHPPQTMIAALQDARFLTERTRASYREIASRGAAVRLHARGLQAWVDPGVSGIDLDEDDPLVDLWCVVLPSPTRPAVLAATDLRVPDEADLDRSFRYALTEDPQAVAECVRLLS